MTICQYDLNNNIEEVKSLKLCIVAEEIMRTNHQVTVTS